MNGQGDYNVSGYINPNPNFMGRGEDDESITIGAMSCVDDQNGGRIRRIHRHTAYQIQELENYYKECPLPTETQRLELGRRLHLEPKQIRFWFQNKRTQTKMHKERFENIALKEEHDRLRGAQEQLRRAMILSSCNICGRSNNCGDIDYEVRKLMAENTILKRETDQFCNFLGYPIQMSVSPSEALPSSSFVISNPRRNAPPEFDLGGRTTPTEERALLMDIAIAAKNELIMLAEMDSPVFKNDHVVEASREMGLVPMTSTALIKTIIDTSKWVDVFAPIVHKASTHRVIPTGSGGTRSGSLQLIQGEFQIISPFVPKRQVKFLRYCEELRRGVWVIVDVTPGQQNPSLLSCGGTIRLPSGLIIEDMGNSYSKVTWIEQAQYDQSDIHQLCKLMFGSGIGLGAKRWLTTLQRHCETLVTLSSINLAEIYPGWSAKGAAELVKLGQRMTLNYYTGINGSSDKWERIQVENERQNMRLMIRKNVNEPGEHSGIVLSAATSVWLPVNQQTLFGFLSSRSFRHEWDILTNNTCMEETIKIQKAKRHGNTVSLLRILENGMLVLQEVWNDASGALVVYAPVETDSMEEVRRGANSDSVQLLPSGFSILPTVETVPDNRGKREAGGGCQLTLALQILVSSKPTAALTQGYVKLVEELVAHTIGKIKTALHIQT